MTEQAMSADNLGLPADPVVSKPLQTASLNWVFEQDDNQWVVTTPDGKQLGFLPAKLDDKEAMGILRFARTFEAEAYGHGKDDGMGAMKAALNQKIVELDMANMVLKRQNQELAEHLDRLIGGD